MKGPLFPGNVKDDVAKRTRTRTRTRNGKEERTASLTRQHPHEMRAAGKALFLIKGSSDAYGGGEGSGGFSLAVTVSSSQRSPSTGAPFLMSCAILTWKNLNFPSSYPFFSPMGGKSPLFPGKMTSKDHESTQFSREKKEKNRMRNQFSSWCVALPSTTDRSRSLLTWVPLTDIES